MGVERFGLNTGLSAALGSVVPEGHSSEEEAEGSASEAADVETKRFGLSTAPSAAAESAFPEDSAYRLWFDKLTTLSQSKSARRSRL